MRFPKISVIMPFYNAEEFLDESINSILNQTFREFELIIINDASSDNSDKIVKKYLKDKRIKYFKNQKNNGIVYNLNHGLKIAKAKIIARMDGDDVSHLNRFQVQYEYLIKHPDIALVGTFAKKIDQKGRVISDIRKPIQSEEIKKRCLIYNPVVHAAAMFRKKIVKKIGGYHNKWLYIEDQDLQLRLIFSGYKLINLPLFYYFYRVHSNSTSNLSKRNARKALTLKLGIIRKFNLNPSTEEYIFIYIQYFLELFLNGVQKEKVQIAVKKIIGEY